MARATRPSETSQQRAPLTGPRPTPAQSTGAPALNHLRNTPLRSTFISPITGPTTAHDIHVNVQLYNLNLLREPGHALIPFPFCSKESARPSVEAEERTWYAYPAPKIPPELLVSISGPTTIHPGTFTPVRMGKRRPSRSNPATSAAYRYNLVRPSATLGSSAITPVPGL